MIVDKLNNDRLFIPALWHAETLQSKYRHNTYSHIVPFDQIAITWAHVREAEREVDAAQEKLKRQTVLIDR